MDPFWLVLVLLVATVMAGYAIIRRRRQVAELGDLARRHRLNFSSLDLIGLHDRYYNLSLIRQGHSRHAWNVLYGSTDAGLVAVFRYSCDVGFGVHQGSKHWWMVVVETPYLHDPWQAEPAETEDGDGDSTVGADDTVLGPFRIRADHVATLDRLCDRTVAECMQQAPRASRWEARGPLLAAAVPVDRDAGTPEHLLDAACELARRLKALPSP